MKSILRFRRTLSILTGLLLFALGPHPAFAAASCSFSVTPSINFGATIDPLTQVFPIQLTGATVTLSCVGNTSSITMSFNKGLNATTISPRKMINGTNTAPYNCYTDGTYTTILGDGTGGSVTESQGAASGNHTYSVMMWCEVPDRLTAPASLNLFSGTYSDTITVTATFL